MPWRHLARLAERGAEELATALGSISEAARAGTGLGLALVSRIDEGQWMVLACSRAGDGGLDPGTAVSLTQTLCARVADSGQTVELPDARGVDSRAERLGVGSYAGVPIFGLKGDLYGTLAVLDREPRASLRAEAEFLTTLSRLATHEIGLHQNLLRLVAEAGRGDDDPGAEPDPVGDLRGLQALVTAALAQTSVHDEHRLRRTLAKETARFAGSVIDLLMKERHLALLPGNAEPWGTEVDRLLVRSPSLLPGSQGTRIRVHATSGAVADIPRRQLERVLVNLVYRAWRTAPPPTPITLSSRVRPGVVEIVVTDIGPEVPAADAATMFDQAGRGMLGLTVVRQLITNAGGTVGYERQGRENRVVVRLPQSGAPRVVEADDTLS